MFDSSSIRIARKNKANKFAKAKKKDLERLIYSNTFKFVNRADVPSGRLINGTRIVEKFKVVDGLESLKSLLVSQNYSDEESVTVATRQLLLPIFLKGWLFQLHQATKTTNCI